MSVGEQLGLDDPDHGLRVQARQRWELWADRFPRLGMFAGPESLPEWLRDADPDARDEVLSALGALGSRDGGDDCAAAGALLWVLLPGASVLAHRLRKSSPIIDELVAAQLWVEARTLPATTTTRVAATILRNTLREVLVELGRLPARDRTWQRCVLLDPASPELLEFPAPSDGYCSAVDLERLLQRASREAVISHSERHLLLSLVRASDTELLARRKTMGGLMSHPVTDAVAAELGVAGRTVRRHATATIQGLARAYATGGARA
jgi:hypothetical protein